ncbi:MAG: protein phosphatase 2C domain-containing protein [Candidatus Liptonbacteria bacterium]|nr:protein phosphatase 2C domain-containing protein [Candidatus Liptonbacteria bacterium]
MKINHIFDVGSSKEDACLIKDNLFAVFDGFNSLDKFVDEQGITGGLIAATITRDVFSRNKGTLRNLAIEANRIIREKMLESEIDIKNKSGLWGTILASVRIKDDSFEWIQLADCLILLIFKDNSYKLLVEDFDHDGEVLKIWKELAGQRRENIFEILVPGPLAGLRANANKTYGVLNGEEEAIPFLKTGEENLQNVKHILLFTDGLMIPKEDPQGKDDWKLFVNLFLQGGLENVKNFVRNLQEDDPKCWKYPRYKQHDDISAISLSF